MVGAKAEEVLGERARELHVPPDHWTEDLLETHEDFVQELLKMGERAAPIVEKVKKREELVQVGAAACTLCVCVLRWPWFVCLGGKTGGHISYVRTCGRFVAWQVLC